jgi:hypothetical protein
MGIYKRAWPAQARRVISNFATLAQALSSPAAGDAFFWGCFFGGAWAGEKAVRQRENKLSASPDKPQIPNWAEVALGQTRKALNAGGR